VHGARGDDQTDRQVDEEDRPPVDQLGQQPSKEHADRGPGAADSTPNPQRPCALAALELRGDDRQGRRRQKRRSQSLSSPRGEQRRGAASHRRAKRRGREHAKTDKEHPTASEQIGRAAPQQQQAPEDQRIARNRPAQIRVADPQILREIGQRDVHRRDVEDHHQLRQGQHRQQPPTRDLQRPRSRPIGMALATVLKHHDSLNSDNSVWVKISDSDVQNQIF
jgi:hypothetical protein